MNRAAAFRLAESGWRPLDRVFTNFELVHPDPAPSNPWEWKLD
jgi:hypothetical protein